ncbi:DNA repair exonuclease [Alicyclobacillus fastidiosus]|uniref:DNA repair exonuclease n=1 Tax=Alicyclobacillus fastidiosus TaxID=392011 RepID=A0ABY6ZHQ2_9BACL|nr:DNA repair exonuclease [Alicyclobacillus fastidiosus]WAH42153.1 DNA repair exonuclease [Alicyclobacillus fastidiosus]
MFRFIHCADIHLDSPMRGLRFVDDSVIDSVRGATRRALENLVELCIQEKVDFLVIAGDVFDGDWEDYTTGLFFNRCMQKLDAADIPVYLIRGNHDAASVLTRHLTLPGNVRVFSERHPETVRIDALQVAVHGQSFAVRDVTENLVLGYPQAVPGYFNIGILHTGLAGREGHARYAPCQLDDLRALGYNYWALGHIHQPEIVLSEPWVVYPGNVQGRHIREAGERGCVLVTVDGSDVTLEQKALDVVRWLEVSCDIEDVLTLGDVLPTVKSAVAQAAAPHPGIPLCMRIGLKGSTPAHQFLYQDVEQLTHEIVNAAQWAVSQPVYVERVAVAPNHAGAASFCAVGPSDSLTGVLQGVAEDRTLQTALAEQLSSWHRLLLGRMQEQDAPSPVDATDTRELVRQALMEVTARLQGGATRGDT